MFLRLLGESFRRQRRRKLLAGTAILLGVTAVTAMLALATTIGDRIQNELAAYGANIVVTPQAEALEVNIGGVNVKPVSGTALLRETDLEKLRTIFWANNITGISPELPVELSAAGQTIHTSGMWFDHPFGAIKTGAPALHPWWKLNGAWPVAPNEVVLGASLANALHLQMGQILNATKSEQTHTTTPKTVSLRIVGVVSTADATDSLALLPLATAQNLANAPGTFGRALVSARTRPEDAFARKNPDTLSPKQRELWYCRPYANSIAYQIHEAIPAAHVEQIRQVEQSQGLVLSRISGLMWLISAAALIAAGFAVSAAMATAVMERRAEIGLMRSLGASRAAIAALFYSESALLAIFAGLIGYLAGSCLSAYLGQRIFEDAATAHLAIFNPVLLPVVLGMALLVAVAGSTPSIRSALHADPTSVLRGNA